MQPPFFTDIPGFRFEAVTGLEPGLLSTCVHLVDRTHGEGVFSPSYFADCAANPLCHLLVAWCEDQVVGVSVARLLPPEATEYHRKFGPEVDHIFSKGQVGSLECASVAQPLQGRGIGRAMAARRIAWLIEQGAVSVVGVEWLSGRRGSGPTFVSLGLNLLGTVPNLYAETSLRLNFRCLTCGEPPCGCGATRYFKLF